MNGHHAHSCQLNKSDGVFLRICGEKIVWDKLFLVEPLKLIQTILRYVIQSIKLLQSCFFCKESRAFEFRMDKMYPRLGDIPSSPHNAFSMEFLVRIKFLQAHIDLAEMPKKTPPLFTQDCCKSQPMFIYVNHLGF